MRNRINHIFSMKNGLVFATMIAMHFIVQIALCQEIEDVNAYVQMIEGNKVLKTTQIDKFGDSSEGTLILVFYDAEKTIRKISSTVLGEMGRITRIYYLRSDSLVFQKRIFYKYSAPFYMKDVKVSVDSSLINCKVDSANCDNSKFKEEFELAIQRLKTL